MKQGTIVNVATRWGFVFIRVPGEDGDYAVKLKAFKKPPTKGQKARIWDFPAMANGKKRALSVKLLFED